MKHLSTANYLDGFLINFVQNEKQYITYCIIPIVSKEKNRFLLLN